MHSSSSCPRLSRLMVSIHMILNIHDKGATSKYVVILTRGMQNPLITCESTLKNIGEQRLWPQLMMPKTSTRCAKRWSVNTCVMEQSQHHLSEKAQERWCIPTINTPMLKHGMEAQHYIWVPVDGSFYSTEIVHWVAESLCPFLIVSDQGFQLLMKMRWPEHYICTITVYCLTRHQTCICTNLSKGN